MESVKKYGEMGNVAQEILGVVNAPPPVSVFPE